MVSTKRMVCLALIGLLAFTQVLFTPKPAHAAGMDVVFKDMGFGLLIGSVMGALVLATNANKQTPEDWSRGIAVGALIGATGGLVIGVASTYKVALINVETDGKMALALPAIQPNFVTGKTSLDVLSYKF